MFTKGHLSASNMAEFEPMRELIESATTNQTDFRLFAGHAFVGVAKMALLWYLYEITSNQNFTVDLYFERAYSPTYNATCRVYCDVQAPTVSPLRAENEEGSCDDIPW